MQSFVLWNFSYDIFVNYSTNTRCDLKGYLRMSICKMNSQDKLTKVLQTIPWWQEINQNHFDKLVGISSLIEVESKQELFREGDEEDYLYIVIQG